MIAHPVLMAGFLFRTKRTTESVRDRRFRIRCPSCEWQPAKADTWSCNPNGCGHVWNTFETLGVCPGCQRQWDYTACLRCAEWSLHELWYEAE